MMLAWLRSRRNRSYRHAISAIVLISWLAFLISATCTMLPALAKAMPSLMPACSEQVDHSGHEPPPSKPFLKCSFKPCLASYPHADFPVIPYKGDPPVLALLLVLTLSHRLLAGAPSRIPRCADPPVGRLVPLIYRFCVLLN